MELRLGDRAGSRSYSFSELKRLFGDVVCSFQNRRGLFGKGDESKGEDSLVRNILGRVLGDGSRAGGAATYLVGLVEAGRIPPALCRANLGQRARHDAAFGGRGSGRLVYAQGRHLDGREHAKAL